MKLKEAIKDANASLVELLTHDHWELKKAWIFYRQSARDFCYATKNFFWFILFLFCIPFLPLFYIFAVVYRVMKK